MEIDEKDLKTIGDGLRELNQKQDKVMTILLGDGDKPGLSSRVKMLEDKIASIEKLLQLLLTGVVMYILNSILGIVNFKGGP